MIDFLTRRPDVGGLGDPAGIGRAFLDLTAKMIADPMSIAQMQLELWKEHVKLLQRTTERLGGGTNKSNHRPVATDRRFLHPAWTENVLFDYIKQSYLFSAEAILSAVNRVDGLNPKTAHKVDFYTRQFVEAMAPSNFLATNPEVLQTTIETGGENLLRGLTNLLDDLERGRGQLAVTMTDLEAFRLGENVATTPGKVIFQNELMQLIQYAPSTIEVKRRPLIIVPPWINKFYVLDLRPETSFIKWAVDQGHTVFVISRRTIWPWPAGMGGMGIMACRWFGQSTRAGGPLQPIEDAPGSYVRARIHTAAGSQGDTYSEMPGLFA